MSHTPHVLHAEFPDLSDRIVELKARDARFARLMDEYHEVNRAVHRAEAHVEPVAHHAEVEMRKQRAALKDELYRMLTVAA